MPPSTRPARGPARRGAGAARGGHRDLLRPRPALGAGPHRRGGHPAHAGAVRRTGRDRQRLLPRRVRHDRARRRGAGGDRRAPARPRHPRPAHPRARADPARRPDPAPAVVGVPAPPPADGVLPRRTRPDPRHGLRQPLPDREDRRSVVQPRGPAPGRVARERGRVRHRQRPRLRTQRTPPAVARGVRRALRRAAAADRARPGAVRGRPRSPGDLGCGRDRRAPARERLRVHTVGR